MIGCRGSVLENYKDTGVSTHGGVWNTVSIMSPAPASLQLPNGSRTPA
jgi:hypothetical protein